MVRSLSSLAIATALIVAACSGLSPRLQETSGRGAAYDEGIAAYQQHDYATAYREFLNAAKLGDDDAVNNLRLMAAASPRCGSPPDDVSEFLQSAAGGNATSRFLLALEAMDRGSATEAQKAAWFASPSLAEASAREGYPPAMFMTAFLYTGDEEDGFKHPRDPVREYAWDVLAFRRGFRLELWGDELRGEDLLEMIASREELNANQIASANEMADQLDKEVPKCRLIDAGWSVCPGPAL